MPNILALDTSTAACSAALWCDGGIAAKRYEIMARGHAEHLMPMVDEVMAQTTVTAANLDLIAVTTGPGAFTGLRLGLAAARGLALALDIPCLGVMTTETLAAALPEGEEEEVVLAALDSKRNDLYVQAFGAGRNPLGPPQAVAPEQVPSVMPDGCVGINRCAIVGDAQAACVSILADAGWLARETDVTMPDAATLAGLAAARWRSGMTIPAPTPLYLRPPDAVIPKDGGRIRR